MPKKVILCIDDDRLILRCLREQLTRSIDENYYIELAESAQEALEICKEFSQEKISLALIICDRILPDMQGDELLCKLHRQYPQSLKILLTGQATFEGIVKAVNQANLYRYISKPWNEIDFGLTVKEALRSYEQSQQLSEQNQILQNINKKLQQEIYERVEIAKKLQESEVRLEGILNALEEVVWSALPENLELLYINPAAETLYGQSINTFFECYQLWREEIIYPEDLVRVQEFISNLLAQNNLTIQYRIIRPNREIRWVKERIQIIYNSEGKATRIDGIIYDITEQKNIQEKLTHDAFHDPLTHLPNRSFFLQQIDLEIEKSRSLKDYKFAIFFIDLDNFKSVNDTWGHTIGDQLLIAIAQRMQNCLRKQDIVARLAGDEFTILIADIQSIQEVFNVANRLLRALSTPYNLENHTLVSGVSIGIVIGSFAYQNKIDLLRDADLAMYQAKTAGKGRYVIL
jgi:diguanylate cyclase (GGDEF)-like protein/PAS domain S-box-containing protein